MPFSSPGGASIRKMADIPGWAASIITGPAVYQFRLGYAHLSGDITGVDLPVLSRAKVTTGECFTVRRSLLFMICTKPAQIG